MNRNTELFYSTMPSIELPRSKWTRTFTHKTTFNAGKLIPFLVDTDIIPGMTIKNQTSIVLRMNTPLYPTMDNLYLDTYYFKIPWWTIWDHCQAFFGENETGAWTQTTEYVIPKFKTAEGHVNGINDINTYMGIRYNSQCTPWNQFGVRAYIRTWNYFFRDENLMAPITMDKSDGEVTIDGTTMTGGELLPVCKFHDYMTSALPEPQKSEAVRSPIGTYAPIVGNGMTIGLTDGTNNYGFGGHKSSSSGDRYSGNISLYGSNVGTSSSAINNTTDKTYGLTTDPEFSGMIADLSKAVAATINAQRLAWATQRIRERDAIFGTRYFQETLRGHYGVTTDVGKDIIPEYLGGVRQPINIETVLQNSSTNEQSPLGQTGAFSVTVSLNTDFIKSFYTHDVLLGVCCVRADHSYQNGIARQWTRERRLDVYTPELSHIGNQPIYNYEIFSDGSPADNEVFGYKEAWAEYKYKNNMISGELLSDYEQSLDAWHYGDDYENLPVLSAEWIKEPTEFIDRSLAVQSNIHNQFTADIYVEQEVAACMPMHCTPGLVDHF